MNRAHCLLSPREVRHDRVWVHIREKLASRDRHVAIYGDIPRRAEESDDGN